MEKQIKPTGKSTKRAHGPSGSWEPVENWYRKSVGEEGHYYHQHVVLPGVMKLLDLNSEKSPSLLDIACGQGVLARRLPKNVEYTGIDIAPSLIKAAQSLDKNSNHHYFVYDVMKPFSLDKTNFTHAAIVLAIQNMENPEPVFINAAKHLAKGGRLVIAMNHPCFRIPRQSSWKVDEVQKVQYRRIDCYSTPLKVPIQAHPGQGGKSVVTWSYHYPLELYVKWLMHSGFVIELIEEWHSDKSSEGRAAKMENKSRLEFPLFMAIRARLL